MGYFTEEAQWDAEIYRIETTDLNSGGENGPVNRAPQALANRTKWVKDTMTTAFDLVGIPTSRVDPVYKGLNVIISDVVFDTGVVDNDAVYLTTEGKFAKAIANDEDESDYVGIADVSNSKVITLGFITIPVVGAVLGKNVYLSDTTSGAVTATETTVCIGKYMGTDVVCLTNAFGFFRGTFTTEAERILKRTVFIYS